jgi:glycine/D-amino acid oxidase-like deaminating enzyme
MGSDSKTLHIVGAGINGLAAAYWASKDQDAPHITVSEQAPESYHTMGKGNPYSKEHRSYSSSAPHENTTRSFRLLGRTDHNKIDAARTMLMYDEVEAWEKAKAEAEGRPERHFISGLPAAQLFLAPEADETVALPNGLNVSQEAVEMRDSVNAAYIQGEDVLKAEFDAALGTAPRKAHNAELVSVAEFKQRYPQYADMALPAEQVEGAYFLIEHGRDAQHHLGAAIINPGVLLEVMRDYLAEKGVDIQFDATLDAGSISAADGKAHFSVNGAAKTADHLHLAAGSWTRDLVQDGREDLIPVTPKLVPYACSDDFGKDGNDQPAIWLKTEALNEAGYDDIACLTTMPAHLDKDTGKLRGIKALGEKNPLTKDQSIDTRDHALDEETPAELKKLHQMLTGASLEGKHVGNHLCRVTIASGKTRLAGPVHNGEPVTEQISTYTGTVYGPGDAFNVVREYVQHKPLGNDTGHEEGHMKTYHPLKARNSDFKETLSPHAHVEAKQDIAAAKESGHGR